MILYSWKYYISDEKWYGKSISLSIPEKGKEVKTMLKSNSASKAKSNPVPKVLLQAKKEAAVQVAGKGNFWDKAGKKGPWDKGHWANRK